MTKGGGQPMILKIGTAIILEKEKNGKVAKYKSKVIDIEDDKIMIDYPTHVETGKTTFVTNETALFVSFTDDLKMSYGFQTKVEGRRLDGVPMLQIAYVGDDKLIKVQRREYVRVDANIDVAVETIDQTICLVTADISAGGLAINLPNVDTLQEQTLVNLLIVLPFSRREIGYVRAKAKVTRIREESGRFIASLAFLNITSSDRQQIVQFCFERQLLLKKKLQ